MAKTQVKVTPKRKRLLGVKVDEVSLVDNPAVPGAVYVLAKRDEGEVEKSDEAEPVKKSPEQVVEAMVSAVKSLRSVASEMDASALQFLAYVMDQTKYYASMYLRDDMDVLKSVEESTAASEELQELFSLAKKLTAPPPAVEKVAETEEVLKEEEVSEPESQEPEATEEIEKQEPEAVVEATEEVVTETVEEVSVLEQVGLLLKKREEEKAAAEKDLLNKRFQDTLIKLTERVKAISDSTEQMAEFVATATGR